MSGPTPEQRETFLRERKEAIGRAIDRYDADMASGDLGRMLAADVVLQSTLAAIFTQVMPGYDRPEPRYIVSGRSIDIFGSHDD